MYLPKVIKLMEISVSLETVKFSTFEFNKALL